MAMSVENYYTGNIVWCKSAMRVYNCIDETNIFVIETMTPQRVTNHVRGLSNRPLLIHRILITNTC